MKRLMFLLFAAGGAAFWWRRRQGASEESSLATSTTPDAATAAALSEPPKLGGHVDAELLEILACPVDKEGITRQGDFLVCAQCDRHYPIRDGIPVMLIDEALTREQATKLAAGAA